MRALLVEDDPLLGDGIKTALEREGYTVDWFMLGREAISAIGNETFSVLILDLGLPDMDGMQVLKLLRRQSTLPILILTARDAVEDRIGGLDAGADDYVLKPFNLQELLARLRVVMRRSEGRTSQILALGALTIDEVLHAVSWRGKDVKLGRREYALLLELARHPDRVLSRPRLENLLYGWDGEVDSNALEVHIHHLRKKLAKHLIVNVRGIGYRLDSTVQ
ncbi:MULTISPECIES: response regulator transcription factor [Halomonas]|jgi:two-component system response regulator QseB|uniref:Response regulator n=1 Tax=Vreelandella lionensis TaxID=1144478 RepID=A0ABW8C003_9GAMM|nr:MULTISPECIES: response regulator transcription factor [Halomonas]KTG22754.1 XRE family transcriptional regulator [Idiomarina sp. H105]OAF13953.1 XRE family transcriptional regulator [Idiomarina sp. WRN-38]HAO02057.1 DNA-binding response regulator [Halomonas sp.]MCC4292422.1 response regulator transcription factor [Halomonas axialensis]MCD1652892.1 response regulator transcription factor [Halomonas axialensis]|tara:strand:+ start:538 stop:1200 length:663 start_codon:yes stop_codon:yes gene_type:complete